MVNRNVLIFTLGLASMAGLTMVLGKGGTKSMPAHLRKAVLESSKTADISHIELKRGEQSLKFSRGSDNVWYLGEAANSKAVAVNQVVQLLEDLTRARLDQVVGSDKDDIEEFGLASPITVSLTARDQKILDVNIGSPRNGGGQYLSIPEDPAIYLTARPLQVNLDEGSWLAPPPSAAEAPPAPTGDSAQTTVAPKGANPRGERASPPSTEAKR